MLAVGIAAAAWLISTSQRRQRRRENRDFDRAQTRSGGDEDAGA